MKKLYLVRHAKSSWDNIELNDFDRPLNDRGRTDATRMGERLKTRAVQPDMMLSSPAVRALTTCKEFSIALSYPLHKIKTDEKLYHADAMQWLSLLTELSTVFGEMESVMIFGHNPGLTESVNQLFNENIDNIPTCGVVAGELPIQNWNQVSWGCGRLLFLDFPKNESVIMSPADFRRSRRQK